MIFFIFKLWYIIKKLSCISLSILIHIHIQNFFLFILVVVSYQYKTFHCFFSSGAAAGVAFLSAPFYFFCC